VLSADGAYFLVFSYALELNELFVLAPVVETRQENENECSHINGESFLPSSGGLVNHSANDADEGASGKHVEHTVLKSVFKRVLEGRELRSGFGVCGKE